MLMESQSPYPESRLAELLAAAENPPSAAGSAQEAPRALVAALRASASAYFAGLPVSEQVEILRCLPLAERDDLLADLPPEMRTVLEEQFPPGITMGI